MQNSIWMVLDFVESDTSRAKSSVRDGVIRIALDFHKLSVWDGYDDAAARWMGSGRRP